MFPSLDPEVERALELCGRDRVFHNDGTPPMVAIHDVDWRNYFGNRYGEQGTIYGKAEGPGEGHSAAGRRAATTFAARLRKRGEELIAWADRIERALLAKSGGGA